MSFSSTSSHQAKGECKVKVEGELFKKPTYKIQHVLILQTLKCRAQGMNQLSRLLGKKRIRQCKWSLLGVLTASPDHSCCPSGSLGAVQSSSRTSFPPWILSLAILPRYEYILSRQSSLLTLILEFTSFQLSCNIKHVFLGNPSYLWFS